MLCFSDLLGRGNERIATKDQSKANFEELAHQSNPWQKTII